MATKYLTAPVPSATMPKGIPYIVGNEAAERFSFYGMKAILMVFMTKYLVDVSGQPATFDKHTAASWVHWFGMAVYFLPIAGAVISDWLFGKYRTILSLSLVYCAGHGVLAMLDSTLATVIEPKTILWIGLALIAVGSGGIKPCVSAHVGDQFGESNQHLLPNIYRWFYFSINFGSTISTLLIPVILDKYGSGWAFGVPGILMALATFVFWLGRNKFVHVPPAGNSFFTDTFSPDGLRAIRNLIPLYLLAAMFFALFEQTQSMWVDQAENLNRVIPSFNLFGRAWGGELLPSQIQAANPILVLVLIPVFSYLVYPLLGKFFRVTPLRTIGIGLFITVPAFAVAAWLEGRIVAGETPSVAWQLLAYFIITCAEIMVSITCLEFSYTQAPRAMKSFIMGLYLLCAIAAGHFIAAVVNEFIVAQQKQGVTWLAGARYYWFFVWCMLAAAVAFVVWSQFYKGETYIQHEITELPPSE